MSANALKVKASELLLFSSLSSNTESHFFLNKKDIQNLPRWDGEGTTPLSADTATAIAIKKHKAKFGKAKLRSISLKSKKTHCDKSLSCPKKLWYYKAKVKGGKKKTYVVLLDGSFVEPRMVKK